MTASDRFDLLFADALQDLAGEQFPDYFDDALDVATRRSQRPSWTFLERWIPMDTATRRTVIAPTFPWRTVGLIVVIIALLVAATAVVIIGSQPSTHPAPPFGPAGNGLVAYAADGDVFVRDLHGGPARKIVGTNDFDVFPIHSRDGTQLLFIRLAGVVNIGDQPTAEVLYVAKADGTELRELFPADVLWAFSWSVDGTQIAVVAEIDGERALYVVNVADGTSRTLAMDVEPVEGLDWRPPDGRELIFRGRVGSQYAIYAIRPDGSGLRRASAVSSDQDFWADYAISPDGSNLLYVNGGSTVSMHALDLDTGEDTPWGGALEELPYTEGELGSGNQIQHSGGPVFSPDGKTIAFGRYWDERSGTINHQVFVGTFASDGADAIPVGTPHRSKSGESPFAYGFSPDGKHLIVQYFDQHVTWLADPKDGTYDTLPWGPVTDRPSWQRIAPASE